MTMGDLAGDAALERLLAAFAAGDGGDGGDGGGGEAADLAEQALSAKLRDLELRASNAEKLQDELLQGAAPQGGRDGEGSDDGDLEEEVAMAQVELELLQEQELALKELSAAADKTQEAHWTVCHRRGEALLARAETLDSLDAQRDLLLGCRQALKQTNVLNDAFFIWYDGPFGTITGLRLGRLPEVAVEWSEINAAWGQVALLLATLAREAQPEFSFAKYWVIPQGSVSKVAKIGSESTKYELYCNGGFFKSSFNNAMVCALHCVKELGDFAETTDRAMRLPYPIDDDKVGGLSIRTGGSEASWTRALKNFLTNLKWLIAWRIKHQRLRFTYA